MRTQVGIRIALGCALVSASVSGVHAQQVTLNYSVGSAFVFGTNGSYLDISSRSGSVVLVSGVTSSIQNIGGFQYYTQSVPSSISGTSIRSTFLSVFGVETISPGFVQSVGGGSAYNPPVPGYYFTVSMSAFSATYNLANGGTLRVNVLDEFLGRSGIQPPLMGISNTRATFLYTASNAPDPATLTLLLSTLPALVTYRLRSRKAT